MSLAIFGISNDGLNLAATLLLLVLIVLWFALVVYTYLDARRRIADPFLVGCATVASFFPYVGTAVYTIVRPPEFLDDAHERELEIRAAELQVRQLQELTCPHCEYPVEKSYLRCPNCQRRLKDPCPSCSKPVDPQWSVCPYCEATLASGERRRAAQQGRRLEAERQRKRPAPRRKEAARDEEQPAARPPARRKGGAAEERKPAAAKRKEPGRAPRKGEAAPNVKQEQRSPSREPDPDPRQA